MPFHNLHEFVKSQHFTNSVLLGYMFLNSCIKLVLIHKTQYRCNQKCLFKPYLYKTLFMLRSNQLPALLYSIKIVQLLRKFESLWSIPPLPGKIVQKSGTIVQYTLSLLPLPDLMLSRRKIIQTFSFSEFIPPETEVG